MALPLRFPRRGLAFLAVLILAGCSSPRDASLSVRLTYPQEGAGTVPATAGPDAPVARPAYEIGRAHV